MFRYPGGGVPTRSAGLLSDRSNGMALFVGDFRFLL